MVVKVGEKFKVLDICKKISCKIVLKQTDVFHFKTKFKLYTDSRKLSHLLSASSW